MTRQTAIMQQLRTIRKSSDAPNSMDADLYFRRIIRARKDLDELYNDAEHFVATHEPSQPVAPPRDWSLEQLNDAYREGLLSKAELHLGLINIVHKKE